MKENKKQIKLFLIIVLGICYLLGIIGLFTQSKDGNIAYSICQIGFTFFPIGAAIIVRLITKDKSKWRFSLKVWKDAKLWVLCAFLPGILIVLGTALYFAIFPNEYSGVLDLSAVLGGNMKMTINSPLTFSLVCILMAALIIPLQLFELGEEIGWREYLLPKQIAVHGTKKGVLLNGFYWGLAHLPLIYFGFNYSLDNFGAPWSNMVLMMLVCFMMGTVLSYVMIKSNNVVYCAIIHGVINFIGEIPIYICVTHTYGLLGPNPTGIIPMSVGLVFAIVLFIRLDKVKSKLGLEKVNA